MVNDTKYNHNTIRLNAGEVATLWAQYQSDTLVTQIDDRNALVLIKELT